MDGTQIQKAKNIIAENLYMTISVCSQDGKPWIANIYYAFDKDYNFYWYSPKTAVHSTYIRENSEVALAIFDSRAVGDAVDAVYIKATAHEVVGKKELLTGLACYAKKLLATKFVGKKADALRFIKQYRDFQGMSALRMYKAVPEKFWKCAPTEMFNGKFVDSRIEVLLQVSDK